MNIAVRPDAPRWCPASEGNGFRLTGQEDFVVDGAFVRPFGWSGKTDMVLTCYDIPADRCGIYRACAKHDRRTRLARIDLRQCRSDGR